MHGPSCCLRRGLTRRSRPTCDFIHHELNRRQLGYGRGGVKKSKKDPARHFAGCATARPIGGPSGVAPSKIATGPIGKSLPVEDFPDLAGKDKKLVAHAPVMPTCRLVKFNSMTPLILERASARENASRVAAPPLLSCPSQSAPESPATLTQSRPLNLKPQGQLGRILASTADLDSPLRCVDSDVQAKMKAEVDAALKGRWNRGAYVKSSPTTSRRLGKANDNGEKARGRLAKRVMSIQAVKRR